MNHLDGNSLAGPAAAFFAFDVTLANGRCRSCNDVAPLGAAMVYGAPMGYVARCRNCDNVLMVAVDGAGRRYLDLGGLTWLRR